MLEEKKVNKAVKKATKETSLKVISVLGNLVKFNIFVYSDASLANLLDGGS